MPLAVLDSTSNSITVELSGAHNATAPAAVHVVTVVPVMPDDIMEDCFNDLLTGQGEGTGWRQLREPLNAAPARAPADAQHTVHNAMLWGGNLTLLTSLLGTPYFPEVRGGILFVEDVAEHPYRVERMLTQLLHAGVLAGQRAVLMGQFTEYKLTAHDKGFKLPSVVAWLRTQMKTPVLTNLPYGHVQTKVLLPVGAKVDLVAQGRDVLMAWGHVS
jgi:muramoyltetrapeptide carboxypeptidase